jgi:hypothetical protein
MVQSPVEMAFAVLAHGWLNLNHKAITRWIAWRMDCRFHPQNPKYHKTTHRMLNSPFYFLNFLLYNLSKLICRLMP